MITEQQISTVVGSTVVGPGGRIGTVAAVYLDDSTGRPEWVTVRTGPSGPKVAFVPLAGAEVAGGELRIPYDADTVANSPHQDVDGHLSPADEADLYRYYGLDARRSVADAVGTARGPELTDAGAGTPGRDATTSGIVGDTATGAASRTASGPVRAEQVEPDDGARHRS